MMFKPFQPDLWISLLVATIVIALLIMLFEGQDTYEERGKVFRKSVFINVIRWNALKGSAEIFHTWQTKILLMGVSIFSILTLTCYTANLTVYLSRSTETSVEYETVNDVIINKEKICTLYAYQPTMKAAFNLKDEHFYLTHSRLELPKLMSDGHCGAAIMEIGDLELFHSKGDWCNITYGHSPILTMNQGFPISDKVAEVFSYWVSLLITRGKFDEKMKLHKPVSVCIANEEKNS